VAVGGGGEAAKQGESPFSAKMRPFIRRLLASQTSEHLLPKIKDVAFCIDSKKCFKKLKLALF
jgi:hypothetical protein